MSLDLTLHTAPAVPLEAEVLSPARLGGLSAVEAAKLKVVHGNQSAELGEFFKVVGAANGELHLTGDLSRLKQIGAAMSAGRIVVHGPAGMHLGAGMTGGEIVVKGDAGDMIGAACRGSAVGIRGGEILVFGNAGNEIGAGMRRGLIAIGGDCGDFAGVNMLAGSVIVLGRLGWRAGAGMKRGTIVSMHPAELLPTFGYACTYRPVFIRLYLPYLCRLGLPVTDAQIAGPYQRWCGDAVELNRGEVLFLDTGEPAARS